MDLYHYFDKRDGPFRNLSDISRKEAEAVLNRLRAQRPGTFAARRQDDYVRTRMAYERQARAMFADMGGKILRQAPHTMVVEPCPWLMSWYEEPAWVRIPIEAFDTSTLSFTYGDLHPTLSPRVRDGREYRGKLYTYEGMRALMEKYGLPQQWNGDGQHGPERYIEVQVWSDETIRRNI